MFVITTLVKDSLTLQLQWYFVNILQIIVPMSVKHLISLEKILAESLLSDTCSSSLRELVRLFRQSPSFSITTHFRSSKPQHRLYLPAGSARAHAARLRPIYQTLNNCIFIVTEVIILIASSLWRRIASDVASPWLWRHHDLHSMSRCSAASLLQFQWAPVTLVQCFDFKLAL